MDWRCCGMLSASNASCSGPMRRACRWARPLRYVRRSRLSATEQDAVLGGNAQAIWQGGEE